eukprot:11787676-Alexandrium_andersonii.AAC.1
MASAHGRPRSPRRGLRHRVRPLVDVHCSVACAASAALLWRPSSCSGPWSPLAACTSSLHSRAGA